VSVAHRFLLGSVVLLPLSLAWGSSPDWNAAAAKVIADGASTLQHGRIGYEFADLESGSILAAKDADLHFVPASNMKLYTTALALLRLGDQYRMRTELRTTGSLGQEHRALPDLLLVGGGDPNLSGRPLPYQVGAPDADPFAGLRELAEELFAAGVRQIDGDVTGVATRYGPELYPDGWTIDDSHYDYGAPVSALTWNDNSIAITVRPTSNGELADLEISPQTGDFVVLNQIVTDPSKTTRIELQRPAASNELVLRGTISDVTGQWTEQIGVRDPARSAAEALISALRERGIEVRGEARSVSHSRLRKSSRL
jgi:serine-type D-Ala-D-Ala carboxypeptidase/endopeptidase (penicillin-binding protein 4)